MNNLDNGMVCHSENIFHDQAPQNFCLAHCFHALFPRIRLNTLVQGPPCQSMLPSRIGWCNDFKRAFLPLLSPSHHALSIRINGINGESCNDMHFRWLNFLSISFSSSTINLVRVSNCLSIVLWFNFFPFLFPCFLLPLLKFEIVFYWNSR